MNVDSENVELVTDLGFAPAYTNQCILMRQSDSGAGVNATSRVDTTFVACDPLSELVWSPHKGLSLKCTEGSFSEKKPSLLRDAGPSNMVLSPPRSLTSRESAGDKQIDEGNLISMQVGVNMESELGEGTSIARSRHECLVDGGDCMVEAATVGGTSVLYTDQKVEKTSQTVGEGLCSPNNYETANGAGSRENFTGPENLNTTDFLMLITNKPKTVKAEANTASEEQNGAMIQWKGLHSPERKLTSSHRKHKNLSSDDEHRSKAKMGGSTSVLPQEKLECTAENDLQLVIGKVACGQSEEKLPSQNSTPTESSPTNSRTSLYRRKGKEKALSDSDVNQTLSKDEDESHESVESCNSAGLLSRGKKRLSFREQLNVGSKRVKSQIHGSPASTSFVRQESSFMNWISNMVNGLNKTSEDKNPSLALTVAPNLERENRDRSRNTGFQNIFQSLYCPNTKEEETKMLNGNSSTEGSKELAPAPKISDANVAPIACRRNGDNLNRQSLLLNKKFKLSAAEMGKTSSISDQNKPSCNLAYLNLKDRINSSSSSLGKQKIDSGENNDSYPPSEAKVMSDVCYRSDPIGSLWITRLASKTTGPMLNLDPCDQNTSAALESSTNHVDISIEQKSLEHGVNLLGKEPQGFGPSREAFFGLKAIHGQNDQKSVYKFNPILRSSKFNSTEAMASVFARRLDALKHIIPSSDVKDNAILTTTCFYCGSSGHDLHDCLEVTEIERENLIRNVSSYDGVEVSSCLCIRCFRLDHWAISCPLLSRTIQQQSENEATFSNYFTASKVHQFVIGNERCPRISEIKVDSQVADAHTNYDQKSHLIDSDKHIDSSSSGYSIKGKEITPLCNLVGRKFADVPKGIFDAIRKIRLSRMDVLKWINSHNSPFHLDGFFLRLRLGKWEEGLGGTGYHVACITGEQREEPPKGSKKSLPVNIGGIKCLVESQYISNQDFLEDELMAWWCATMRSGGKLPSEDHLRLKFEQRKRLGF